VLATPKRTLERKWRAVQAWLASELDMDDDLRGPGRGQGREADA